MVCTDYQSANDRKQQIRPYGKMEGLGGFNPIQLPFIS